MNLVKTSFLTGISTIVKIFTGFIINKIISIYIGPSGLAVIGQFRDFMNIIMSLANGGIQQGIIKYSSEYKFDNSKLQRLISSSLLITLSCSLSVGGVIYLFKDIISVNIFNNKSHTNVFSLLSITLLFLSLNTLFISILNGLGEIKKFVAANIVASLISLVLTSSLIYFYKLNGALISLAVNQSVIVFSTVLFLKSGIPIKLTQLSIKIDRAILMNLSQFSLMTLVSAFTIPLVLIGVRRSISDNLSWEEAGYWEGIWRFSNIYLTLLSTSFSVYLLPTFSKLSTALLKKEIFKAWMYVIPLTILMIVSIYLSREWIVKLLFTESFVPMAKLFLFQLLGDVFKISSWVLGNVVIAKAMTKLYILTEISWSILFFLLSTILIQHLGLQGVTVAYFISYVTYFIFMNIYFYKLLWAKKVIQK